MTLRLPVPVTQILLVLLFIGVWQAASSLGWTDPDLLPPFSVVIVAAARMLVSQEFLSNAGVTVLRILVAFAIGAPLAISFGLFLGERIGLRRAVAPVINFVMAVPQSIFLPIFIFCLGIGFTEKVVYGVTHVLFVVTVTAMAAVQQVPRSYVVAAQSFGWSPANIYRKVYLPAMAPVIVTGLRMGLIFNIIGVLLAEMYASQTGLGVLIVRWGEAYETTKTMAVILLVSGATILVNEAMRVWENRMNRWRAEMDGHG